ncbi:hypothetical protein BKA93DRAFT_157283 [Sparassis latifolia]
MPRQLAVDSSKARKQFTQCQQCYKGKDRAKLFVCAGYLTDIQSAKCRKEHWPFHKMICKQHQERVSHIAFLDDQVLSKASTSTISDELASTAWTSPIIPWAGLRWCAMSFWNVFLVYPPPLAHGHVFGW